MSKQFEMKDLGGTKQILGMRITRDKAKRTLKLSQAEYVRKVLSRLNMDKVKPVSTPKNALVCDKHVSNIHSNHNECKHYHVSI